VSLADEHGNGDPWVQRLGCLFSENPAWRAAAGRLAPAASSTVHFSHLPSERFRLEREAGGPARLLPGAAADPDLVFRFTPGSIERLEASTGAIGDVAVTLFELILAGEVDLRIAAGFPRLARRGYVLLLLAGGAAVARFGAQRGISGPRALARVVAQLRARGPADWEL
jgi:hypothetical protein